MDASVFYFYFFGSSVQGSFDYFPRLTDLLKKEEFYNSDLNRGLGSFKISLFGRSSAVTGPASLSFFETRPVLGAKVENLCLTLGDSHWLQVVSSLLTEVGCKSVKSLSQSLQWYSYNGIGSPEKNRKSVVENFCILGFNHSFEWPVNLKFRLLLQTLFTLNKPDRSR